ncbi:MAG: hypothetical protein CV088_09760 [Nitrospira sp. LK70]|nr:hypothetical protein [Nitrospira sp. LK70]
MNTTIQGDGKIQHIGWPTGTVGGLLLISLGLELLARQVFGRIDVVVLGALFGLLDICPGHDRVPASRSTMVNRVATPSGEPSRRESISPY